MPEEKVVSIVQPEKKDEPKEKGIRLTVARILAITGPEGHGALADVMRLKLAARVAYRVLRVIRKLDAEREVAVKAIMDLRRKYGFGDESIPPEKLAEKPEFAEEAEDLESSEVVVDIEPVELPPDCQGVTPGMLVMLDGIVTVKE